MPEVKEIPIVVAAFNKVRSLSRLLSSLNTAHYSVSPIKLIISVDGGGNVEVRRVAQEFQWSHGEKEVIIHPENLGLRKHILYCGSLSQLYSGILLLEDDLLVSPCFYNYALQVVSAYNHEEQVCGMALYSPCYNETSYMPFHPLNDGSDGYFMQLPCSWGQIWLKEHWIQFSKWYEENQHLDLSADMALPHNIRLWPETSWKKYFAKYMLTKEQYFFYPYNSFTTNFGESGQHHTGTHLFQVPLSLDIKAMKFVDFKESQVKYDSFCEIQPECLKRLCSRLENYDFDVDLHGTKEKEHLNSKYVITSKKSEQPILTFGKTLLPIENNLIHCVEGSVISFSENTLVEDIEDMNVCVWLKSNDFSELCYYYPLDKRHIARLTKKLEISKIENHQLKEKKHQLQTKTDDLLHLLTAARNENSALRDSYSFKIGQMIITPFSYLKNLIWR